VDEAEVEEEGAEEEGEEEEVEVGMLEHQEVHRKTYKIS